MKNKLMRSPICTLKTCAATIAVILLSSSSFSVAHAEDDKLAKAKALVSQLHNESNIAYELSMAARPECGAALEGSTGLEVMSRREQLIVLKRPNEITRDDHALIVTRIHKGSPAATAELLVKDKILMVNDLLAADWDKPAEKFKEIERALIKSNASIKLTLDSGQGPRTVTLRPIGVCPLKTRFGFLAVHDLPNDVNAFLLARQMAIDAGEARGASKGIGTFLHALSLMAAIAGRPVPPGTADMIDRGVDQKISNDASSIGLVYAARAGYSPKVISQYVSDWAAGVKVQPFGAMLTRFKPNTELASELTKLAEQIEQLKSEGKYLSMAQLAADATPENKANPDLARAALLHDVAAVPVQAQGKEKYERFLASQKRPRAYVIDQSGGGYMGFEQNALAKAMKKCEESGATCVAYAVDGEVVWKKQ